MKQNLACVLAFFRGDIYFVMVSERGCYFVTEFRIASSAQFCHIEYFCTRLGVSYFLGATGFVCEANCPLIDRVNC